MQGNTCSWFTMASDGVVVSSENNPVYFIACMDKAKTLSTQMQFRNATEVLHEQVLKPIVCKINPQSYRNYTKPNFTDLWRKPRVADEHNVNKLFEILCEAFAQLTEVCILSGLDSCFNQELGKFLQELVTHQQVQDNLFSYF